LKGALLSITGTETEDDSLTDMTMANDPTQMSWIHIFQGLEDFGLRQVYL